MPTSKTVVISCAGMGKRLGIGVTKALVEVDGVPLIIRHLRHLDAVDDVRVVVGYQAERVIEAVRRYRNDVTFVFNHDYMNNGTGASVTLAAKHANDLILTLDGDLLVHPDDMRDVLVRDDEFVGVTSPGTDGPVLVMTEGTEAVGFSREEGEYEWTGVMQIRSDRLSPGNGHVYQLIEGLLPLPAVYLRTREIDTPNDYEHASAWVKNGFSNEKTVGAIAMRNSWRDLIEFATAFASEAQREPNAPRLLTEMLPGTSRTKTFGGLEASSTVLDAIGTCRSMVREGATAILFFDLPKEAVVGHLETMLPRDGALTVMGREEIASSLEECGSMSGLAARVFQKVMA